ncbi:MAG: porphobilinogen synthase [Acidobacteria bacterium]|nr:MAG: porphobilinogen synthase [Acidobacteriota bacterium]
MYPLHRPRRLRVNAQIRNLVRETSIQKSQLIYPMFIYESGPKETPIDSMPGVSQFNITAAIKEASSLYEKGIRYFLLFGIPDRKDDHASSAYISNGVIQQTIKKLKSEIPEAIIFTDVCLCGYTDHGHCGVIENGKIDNDRSVEILAKTALSHAEAGADFVAPSDMMDGRVLAIRKILDENSFQDVGLLSYAAKFSSSFYGPFRDAAHSAPKFGDRKTHQMDPGNRREALKEMESDLEEGADMLMVKPALAFLDIIREAKDRFLVPIVAYNVSGEYSLVKAAAQKGWIDEKAVRDEILLSMRRAGADIIITYFAKDIAFE